MKKFKMKWPSRITIIRHDVSEYNALKEKKLRNPLYQKFLKLFEKDPTSQECKLLAKELIPILALNVSGPETPLANAGANALIVGASLRKRFYGEDIPKAIYVSPFLRTLDTLASLKEGWPELACVEQEFEDERLFEQDYGLAELYNDWRILHTLEPDQRKFYNQRGSYWYRYPQGESVPDVRLRVHSWVGTIIREHAGKHIVVVTHHLTLLAIIASIQRLNAKQFIDLNENKTPINCGVTIFECDPTKGKKGKMKRVAYNEKLY